MAEMVSLAKAKEQLLRGGGNGVTGKGKGAAVAGWLLGMRHPGSLKMVPRCWPLLLLLKVEVVLETSIVF